MSKEKQIEQRNELLNIFAPSSLSFEEACLLTDNIINAGYRKQSENTVEIVRCKECRNCEKVPSILDTVLYCNEWCKDVAEDTFCSFGAKMKGGAE